MLTCSMSLSSEWQQWPCNALADESEEQWIELLYTKLPDHRTTSKHHLRQDESSMHGPWGRPTGWLWDSH